jgi:hypothetical protein
VPSSEYMEYALARISISHDVEWQKFLVGTLSVGCQNVDNKKRASKSCDRAIFAILERERIGHQKHRVSTTGGILSTPLLG